MAGKQKVRNPTWRRTTTWAAILAVAAAVLAAIPGTNVLSFYFCLVMAPLLGMACGGVAVTAVSFGRACGHSLWASWGRAFRASAILVLVPLVVALLNGLRVPPCDIGYGLLFFAVGPAASALMGCVTGAAMASLVPYRPLAHGLFLAIFVGTFIFNLNDLYRQPAVSFYNPFLGLYPGAIYDERIEVGAAYFGFRALCIAVMGVLVGVVLALVRRDFSFRLSRSPSVYLLLGGSLGAAVTLWAYAGDIGFRTTREDVEKVLSGEVSDEYCVVRHDPGLDGEQVRRLLEDCAFRHRQMAAFFGLSPKEPIRLYVYRDENQKARWMGARQTEVSKPWLKEVHMAAFSPGDPVLGHEIAHVVAGRLATNFLALPLRWGVVPDVPVVEGLAVAAAFVSDGPSPHEWSLAMIRAGLPADPVALWRTDSFLLAHAGRAYTLAGSFLRFIADHFGPQAIRDLAQGRSLEEATGQQKQDLVAQWQRHLEDVAGSTVDQTLLLRATHRFEGEGVLLRRCPVDIARRLASAAEAESAGHPEGAALVIKEALDLDPKDRALARGLLLLRARAGDEAGTRLALSAFESDIASLGWRDLVAVADAQIILALRRGEAPEPLVRAMLDKASTLLNSGPEGRTIAARVSAMDLPPEAALRVILVLTGGQKHPTQTLFEALVYTPDAWLIHYLLGRFLAGEGQYQAAVHHLQLALTFRLPSLAFDAEAHRVLGESAFWLKDWSLAGRHLLLALDLARTEGERMRIEEFLERFVGQTPER